MIGTEPPFQFGGGLLNLAVAQFLLVVVLFGVDLDDTRRGDEAHVAHTVDAVGEEDGEQLAASGQLFAHGAQAAVHAILRVIPADEVDEYTELIYQDISFKINLDDSFFSLQQLRRR